MPKVVEAVLASSPVLAFLLWAAWWLTLDALDQRRRARAAAAQALKPTSRESDAERSRLVA
jgi:hypothetical protein